MTLSIDDDSFIELKASSLHGVAEILLRQVAILGLSVDEVHRHHKNKVDFFKEQLAASQQTIMRFEEDQEDLMRLIDKLKKENTELKGGDHVAR
jgi:molybdopterin converting factor small subunit